MQSGGRTTEEVDNDVLLAAIAGYLGDSPGVKAAAASLLTPCTSFSEVTVNTTGTEIVDKEPVVDVLPVLDQEPERRPVILLTPETSFLGGDPS